MRILKRMKGKKEYYYLQHSYRKDNKVITREKYLGAKIPKNIEKIKDQFNNELKSDIYEKLESIKDNFQTEWKRVPESAKEKQLKEISIAFSYNTNAIEGSTITLEETREIIHDKIAPNKSLRDIKEIESHNKIFLDILNKKEKMSINLILMWHKEIFHETKPDISGKLRDYLVSVGNHRAPDWQDLPKLMQNLIEFINKNINKMNPVELAARAHFVFEKIHPFGDGNGRIGRLLINYILWHSKYPMIIIEYKKRKSYYKAFEKDVDNFIRYFIRRYLAVHKKRIK